MDWNCKILVRYSRNCASLGTTIEKIDVCHFALSIQIKKVTTYLILVEPIGLAKLRELLANYFLNASIVYRLRRDVTYAISAPIKYLVVVASRILSLAR